MNASPAFSRKSGYLTENAPERSLAMTIRKSSEDYLETMLMLQEQQGYIRSETAAAATVRLTPVWRLETDTGLYQINGMTGEVTALP